MNPKPVSHICQEGCKKLHIVDVWTIDLAHCRCFTAERNPNKKVRWAVSLFKSNSWWHLSGTSFTVYDLGKQGLHCLVRPMLVHSWDPQDASCEVHADHAGFAYWLSDLSIFQWCSKLFFQRFQPSRTSRCWMCLPDASAIHCLSLQPAPVRWTSTTSRTPRAINFNVIPGESGSQHVGMGQYLLVYIFRYF